jgi:TetR/AcrR family transcriptional regulator, transcriptional repressor for nem operon
MARPREFEPNEALSKAMRLFWQKGYLNTSLDDLVQATGVSRYGFYTTFGDKHDLFIKVMDHYAGTVIPMMLGPLETPEASVPEIRRYFDYLLLNSDPSRDQAGCLIGNTAMEIGQTDEAIADRINRHFARMRGAFLNALQNAAERGELSSEIDVEAYADYLVGIAVGYLVCIRAKISQTALQHFIKTALIELS